MTTDTQMTMLNKIRMLALVCPFFAAAALAQVTLPDEAPGEDEARRYTVEIIIFAYAEDVGTGTERFPPDEPEPEPDEFDTAIEPDAKPEPPVTEPLPGEDAPTVEFTLLADDELTMTSVIEQFDRLDVYDTMMHFGWTQTTLPEEETRPVELRVFGDPPAGLDGSISLYLSRYLHLVVDLALQAPEPDGIRSDPDSRRMGYDDSGYRNGDRHDGRYTTRPEPVYYRIQENRIMKNGDLRYFDHPKYGVVAKVTRIEDDADDAGQPDSGTLLGGSSQ